MIPKYRAWDKVDKVIREVTAIDWSLDLVEFMHGAIERSFENVILMQSTGLKDKNGVEIFEGDIISGWVSAHSHSGRDEVLKVVEYQVDRARYNFDAIDVFVDDKEYLEVIGNIYENPELLGVPK